MRTSLQYLPRQTLLKTPLLPTHIYNPILVQITLLVKKMLNTYIKMFFHDVSNTVYIMRTFL